MGAKIGKRNTTVGAENAFTTIQPDNGTAPVADSDNDTLTLTSSDGSIEITGDSGTDTIDFVIPATSIIPQRIAVTIPASTTLVVDTVALSNFRHLEYVVTYEDLTTNDLKSSKILILNDNSSLDDSVFGRNGSNIKVALSATTNAGNMELEVTNSETNSVLFVAQRSILN